MGRRLLLGLLGLLVLWVVALLFLFKEAPEGEALVRTVEREVRGQRQARAVARILAETEEMSVRVRAVDREGEPVEGVWVELREDGVACAKQRTDSNGETTQRVPPDCLDVEVDDQGWTLLYSA